MSQKIFLLSPLAQRGGNYCTINRISDHLLNEGFDCQLYDPKDFSTRWEFNTSTSQKYNGIMIGIHALHSGAFMKDSSLPYILILGGTDMNVFCDDPPSMEIMTEAVYGAKYVVCFSKVYQDRALLLWPAIRPGRLKVITQAVQTCPSSFSLRTYLDCHYSHILRGVEPAIFVFVGGIRPVKNPLFLVSTFQDWHARDHRVIYLMIGPKLDETFTVTVFEPAIKQRAGVIYIPGLPSEDAHAAISQSFALVNSSDSEGMCLAVLEAMHLGVPILARDCPGNRAIVTDGLTGFLFDSPQMFLEKAEQLVNNNKVYTSMARQALQYVQCNHDLEQERRAYTDLLNQCIQDIEADS